MTRTAFISSIALLLISLSIGCPQGSGIELYPEDASADAADAARSDASSSEAGASDASATDTSSPSTGALCGVNGRRQCGPFMTCDPRLGCVECSTDADCPASARLCLQGRCVGCRPRGGQGSDCPPGQACSSADFECHPSCTTSCPSDMRCDASNGECVGCQAPADCPSNICSRTTRSCVECESDEACGGQRPRCRQLTGACVACLSNADCGLAAPICDPTTFECRIGCTSNAQCPGQLCDLDTAVCEMPDAGVTDGG